MGSQQTQKLSQGDNWLCVWECIAPIQKIFRNKIDFKVKLSGSIIEPKNVRRATNVTFSSEILKKYSEYY